MIFLYQVQNVGQLKFVTDEDLTALGMSRPEIRRLKKFFQKYHPQTYLSKFKKVSDALTLTTFIIYLFFLIHLPMTNPILEVQFY